ncbi:SusC/RagA family TonB-linked outer membrane protein [Parapedobacter indicus]|uniref:TonB-linked outer membrane protein, SusC/RagA family n=1 Tax=Parapedobacter indicus TaxID=1477437 RepID=A0A1I3RP01_9SPHI|nr:SusC/RagA family TonB-linked outer membrane protein [Parapedobacter indicus]PPL00036.1 TonB-linked SusC/RagA family outer membrane protein [Parapedobacter indicus]SFJ48283.1 TonB-linked outer membrane protein, SusC/RagA family [Parapedobacter indicus]
MIQTFAKFIFLLVGLNYAQHAWAQQLTVKGQVTDAASGEPLSGATVSVVGSTVSTTSDENGRYSLVVHVTPEKISVTFLGYQKQEQPLGGQTELDFRLVKSDASLDEVVVTALGIKRERKSLGYSVGNVDGEALNETPQANVLNALSGKVAGVQISQMDGTAGSSVNMVIRGANSLNGDNQPLFVIDGVPVSNQLNNGFSGADMGNAISDINPNDIENVSVLKGPSAAALYGSRAGNGVVLITTKSGAGSKRGIGVSLSAALTAEVPYRYVPVQNKFGNGKAGAHLLEESENENWGAELDAGEQWVQWNSNGQAVPLVSYPDRFQDFFQTGLTSTNNVAVDGSYDKGNFRLSVGNMENKGIIPNTDLSRVTLALNTSYRLTDRLRATANFGITESGSDNRPVIDGERNSPVRSLYETGAQVNILDLVNYWIPGMEGIQQLKYKDKQNNPYFLAYENPTSFKRNRTVSKLQLDYTISDDFAFLVRYARDETNENQEAKRAYSNFNNLKGSYQLDDNYRKEDNIDATLSYKKEFASIWSINAMAGFNRMERQVQIMNNYTSELVIPDLYSISNGAPGTVVYDSFKSRKLLYGVYGTASVGFADKIYLDLTARNDWSSTLPSNNRSYFYPSASLSFLLHELVALPDWLTFLKLRAGSAQVGNDVEPYSLRATYSNDSDWGSAKRLYMGNELRNATLEPEISTSHEAGLEFQFLGNRLGFEATYYTVNNKNQVLSIGLPIESGAGSKLINAGLVRSRGIEARLSGTPIQNRNFRWDMNVTFTRNRTVIEELAEGIEYFNFTSYSGLEVRTYAGGGIGDMYMRPMLTVKDKNSPYYGYPLLTNSGVYQTDNDISNLVKIGNFNHDFMLSFQPSFTYKSFSLYANIDWRQGGMFYSNTMMFLGNNGQLEETLSGASYDRSRGIEEQVKASPEAYFGKWIGGRNADYGGLPWPGAESEVRKQDASFNIGVREVIDENGHSSYVENLGGATTVWLDPFNAYRYSTRPFPDRNLYSATYVKLREIALTYRLPQSFSSRLRLQQTSVSFVANNVFQWNAAGIDIDPERAYRQSAAGWIQGVEYYNVMPWTASFGLKLTVNF